MPAPPPARAPGHHVHARLVCVGPGRWNWCEVRFAAGLRQTGLPLAVRPFAALPDLVQAYLLPAPLPVPPAEAGAPASKLESVPEQSPAPKVLLIFRLQPERLRQRALTADLHRNTPAAKAEERVDRRVLRASFCDAASARASIYACKAFNTEERVGSICHTPDEPNATAAKARQWSARL
jgi:hypothetical protein